MSRGSAPSATASGAATDSGTRPPVPLSALAGLLRRLLRPYGGALAGIITLQLVATIASLYLPSLNARIIDEGIATGDTGFILRFGGWMLLVSGLNVLASYAAVFLGSRVAAAVGRDARESVVSRVLDLGQEEVTRFGAPTLISRGTNDATQVQTLTQMLLTMMVTAPIMMVGGVVMALREDLGLAWLVAVAVPVLAIWVGLVIRQMVPSFSLMQTCVDLVNRVLREQITGVRVVRAFVREDHERDRFGDANAQYTAAALRVGRLQAIAFPVVMFVFNASMVAVLWFGGIRVADGQMQIGALTAFMAYLMQILMSVMMLTFMSMMVPRAAVSAGRINEVLGTRAHIQPPTDPVPIPDGPLTLEIDDVTFRHTGAEVPALRGVSLTVRPGTTTAVIGSTGAGKTTLVDLVPRLHDVTAGAVRLGGVDVRDADPEDLWSRLGLVPQRPYLFSGTVAQNLRHGRPDATDEELWAALTVAQAAGFVREMPDGLDSVIAQGGTNVSGGQRQRLAIARAVVRRPAVYVFDDSFSALDLATDARLRAALAPITADAAVLVVAQRVSTIVGADRIIVLEDGQVVGAGRHEELLAGCRTYAEIVESQGGMAAA